MKKNMAEWVNRNREVTSSECVKQFMNTYFVGYVDDPSIYIDEYIESFTEISKTEKKQLVNLLQIAWHDELNLIRNREKQRFSDRVSILKELKELSNNGILTTDEILEEIVKNYKL